MNNEYFLSINDVSKRLDLPAHTLRYWEKQFPAAIKPTTGAGGRRYYRAETVAMLESIKEHLYNRGMTIAGVKKLIKEGALEKSSEFKIQSSDVRPKPVVPQQAAPTGKPDIAQAIDLLERACSALS